MREKKLLLATLMIIVACLGMSSCANKVVSHNTLEKAFLCEAGQISYITEGNEVCYLQKDGITGIYEASDNAKAIYGNSQVTVLLKNNGSVKVYSYETHMPINSKYLREKVEDEGTGNGGISEYANMCEFFEQNGGVEELLFWNQEYYAAKINSKWIGPLIEAYPDVDFAGVVKLAGLSYEPTYALRNDGKIETLADAPAYLKKQINEEHFYVDILVGVDELFLLDSSGEIYSSRKSNAKDWENIVAISGTNSLAAISKNGNVLLESEHGSLKSEIEDWKDIILISKQDEGLVGVNKEGYILMTSKEREYYQAELSSLPRVRLK